MRITFFKTNSFLHIINLIAFILLISLSSFAKNINNPVQTQEYAYKYPDLQYDKYEQPKVEKPIEDIDTFDIRDYLSVEVVWIIFITILVLMVFIIIRTNGFNIFKKRVKITKQVNIQEAEKHINDLDFDQLINHAILNNDKSSAVRFYFLKCLKHIANQKHINWEIQKTNNDYLYEIKNQQLKKDFEYANYLYTYIWFGKFVVSDEQFKLAENHFKNILNNNLY